MAFVKLSGRPGYICIPENPEMLFTATLLAWYEENRRDLPWRRTKDPYLIWLSEVIMQQTRIEQGLSYYERFAEKYLTVYDLAFASEQEVLKLWQGLGYYSRARNLHHTARMIVEEQGGSFPSTYEGIRALKGVGDYTAAAIGSISFNLPVPVVDGNVLRFFSRHFGILDAIDSSRAKNEVHKQALHLIPLSDPGTFNQAMMEFGAKYCKPSAPDCENCPFMQTCFALAKKMVTKLPLKAKPVAQVTRYFHYLVICSADNKRILMRKREADDIWKGLYDFPMIETKLPVSIKALTGMQEWTEATDRQPFAGMRRSGVHRHVLTHQIINARFYRWVADPEKFPHLLWVDKDILSTIPLPRLIDRYLQSFFER